MEKEKKTKVTVLKIKFGSYKSISTDHICCWLCSGCKELQHINFPNQTKIKKRELVTVLYLQSIDFQNAQQKLSTPHLNVLGYVFHPVTKYHKLYRRVTCRLWKMQFCSTLINRKMFAAVSSWSELRSLNSCIILIIEKAVDSTQSSNISLPHI